MTAPVPPPLAEWMTVEPGVLYRCQQPGYGGHDAPHEFTADQVAYLRAHGVCLVVSANEVALTDANVRSLADAGVDYRHFPVPDFTAPTREQAIAAAAAIDTRTRAGEASLVYCGYGHGRTGTLVTAWEILTDNDLRRGAATLQDLCGQNHVERPEQEALLGNLDARDRGRLDELRHEEPNSDSDSSDSDDSDSSGSDSSGSNSSSDSGDSDSDDSDSDDSDSGSDYADSGEHGLVGSAEGAGRGGGIV